MHPDIKCLEKLYKDAKPNQTNSNKTSKNFVSREMNLSVSEQKASEKLKKVTQ